MLHSDWPSLKNLSAWEETPVGMLKKHGVTPLTIEKLRDEGLLTVEQVLRVYPRQTQEFAKWKPGRGVIENKHSTDVESSTPPLRARMSIHPEGKACSDIGSSACSHRPSCQT